VTFLSRLPWLSGRQVTVEASLFPTFSVPWTQLSSEVAGAELAALHNEPLRIENPERTTRSSSDPCLAPTTAACSYASRSKDDAAAATSR